MKAMPEAEIYQRSIDYWSYQQSVEYVILKAIELVPENGRVVDFMCGTGYVLGEIAKKRPDVSLLGIDIDPEYVAYANAHYPAAHFGVGDVLAWRTEAPFDLAICTGAIHHVPYDKQESAIETIALATRPGGTAIISDCYIDPYRDETERKLGAARLGYEYLRVAIQRGAPEDVLGWTIDILTNDVQGRECKDSLANRLPKLQRHFSGAPMQRIWPAESTLGYGDVVHICTR